MGQSRLGEFDPRTTTSDEDEREKQRHWDERMAYLKEGAARRPGYAASQRSEEQPKSAAGNSTAMVPRCDTQSRRSSQKTPERDYYGPGTNRLPAVQEEQHHNNQRGGGEVVVKQVVKVTTTVEKTITQQVKAPRSQDGLPLNGRGSLWADDMRRQRRHNEFYR